jgi:hypothetical protein
MTQAKSGIDVATLRVGQRVSRKTTDELGTVTEADGKVKVEMGWRSDELLSPR